MNQSPDLRMSGAVTAETVRAYVEGKGFEPYQVDGIPEGFLFVKRIGKPISTMHEDAYLIGFTPGEQWQNTGAVFYQPIIYPQGSSKELVEQVWYDAEHNMLDFYKDNKSKVKDGKK